MIRDVAIEDLLVCPSEENFGGIATRIWYAPITWFSIFIPPSSDEYEDSRLIDRDSITIITGKKLKFIDVYLDQNSLSEKSTGTMRALKQVSELSFSILGMTAKNLGFISKVANTGLVFFIPDSNGRIWVLGNKQNASYMKESESNSGRKYDDDSLTTIGFSANTPLYIYNGDISNILSIGAFNKGFNNGFKI